MTDQPSHAAAPPLARAATILLVGAGAVGARTARQLVETPGVGTVVIADRDSARADRVAEAVGPRATVVTYRVGDALPAGVDAVANALPGDAALRLVDAAIAAGCPTAVASDAPDTLDALLTRDAAARAAAVPVVGGCGLAPGISDVLVCHAASSFDSVEEIFVARAGVAGSASEVAMRRARREPAVEVSDGRVREARRPGEELVWFPDPIGPIECEPVAPGVQLLHDAFGDVRRIGIRFGEVPGRRWWQRADPAGGWGATRVEVWGTRGSGRAAVVYGVVERTAIAAGTLLALTTVGLLGVVPVMTGVEPGVQGVAAVADPLPFLGELARRGVKAAVFDGMGA